MASVADYGMILDSVKKIDRQDEAIKKQQLSNLALNNDIARQKFTNDQKSNEVEGVFRESIKKNTAVDPVTGQVKTNHDAVAADLANSGYGDKAAEYIDKQHAATYEKHKQALGVLSQAAQGVMSQPEAARGQAYQSALAQIKGMGIDTNGAPEQYDPNFLTGVINAAIDGKTHFEGGIRQQAEDRKAISDAAHIKSEDARTQAMVDLAGARANKLTLSDSSNMDPEDVSFYGEQYAKGDPSVIKNMSKVDAAAVRSAARKFTTDSGGDANTAINDRQDNAAVSKAIKDFSTGKQGNSVRSFNTALEHIHSLEGIVDSLDNGDIQIVNKAKNAYASATGKPAPTNFDATKKIVADEIVKAIIGASGGVADREEAARVISSANSPAQLKGVIDSYKELMSGQLKGLEEQYISSTGRKDFSDKYLTKKAKDVRDSMLEGGSGKNGMTPGIAPQGVTVSNW